MLQVVQLPIIEHLYPQMPEINIFPEKQIVQLEELEHLVQLATQGWHVLFPDRYFPSTQDSHNVEVVLQVLQFESQS